MRWMKKMNHKLWVFGWLAVVLFLSGNSFADTDEGWRLRKDEQGIAVYAREIADSPIDEIRATATLQAPYPVVLALLLDHTARPKWNSLCQEARVLNNSASEEQQRVYFYYKMPWPVADRDLVMKLLMSETDGAAIMKGSAVADDSVPVGKAVRVSKAREEWQIERVDENSTRVTMTALMDPAGPIPAWLINALSVSQPFEACLLYTSPSPRDRG